MSLAESGVPGPADLRRVCPAPERLARGPVAVFECFQEIPCDPCREACPTGAVLPFADINDLPRVDHDRCNGCGRCVTRCPGLAVFVVDETYSPEESLVGLPYEFLPRPRKGQRVTLLDREGELAGEGRIVRVQSARDRTLLVWLAVPKDRSAGVRHFRPLDPDGAGGGL